MVATTEQAKFKYLKLMLRPIIRYCLKRTLSIQDFIEAAKQGFVEIAMEEIAKEDLKVNTSRLSVITGLQRREVMRVSAEIGTAPATMSLVGRVIGQWTMDKRFLTARGKPQILTTEGKDSQFKELIELISKDVNPGTVLFELERCGIIKRVDNGVKLNQEVLLVSEDLDSGFRILAQDTEDLISAVEQNLFEDNPIPNLHARTEYDNVSLKDIPKIKKWLVKEGSRFHRKARSYIAQFDKDINADLRHETGGKVVLSTFSNTSKG